MTDKSDSTIPTQSAASISVTTIPSTWGRWRLGWRLDESRQVLNLYNADSLIFQFDLDQLCTSAELFGWLLDLGADGITPQDAVDLARVLGDLIPTILKLDQRRLSISVGQVTPHDPAHLNDGDTQMNPVIRIASPERLNGDT